MVTVAKESPGSPGLISSTGVTASPMAGPSKKRSDARWYSQIGGYLDKRIGRVTPARAESDDKIVTSDPDPKISIKQALHSFYRFLKLLQMFRETNAIALYKITKKFKKATNLDVSELEARLQETNLMKAARIDALITSTESIFASLTEMARKDAMKILRSSPQKKSEQMERSIFLVSGVSGGFALTLFCFSVYRMATFESFTSNQRFILPSFAGLGVPLLILYMSYFCVYYWYKCFDFREKFEINYARILKLDTASSLGSADLVLITSLSSALFSFLFFAFLFDLFQIAPFVYPLVKSKLIFRYILS